MQQFEMHATMEWLAEKVKGGATGAKKVPEEIQHMKGASKISNELSGTKFWTNW
jgi:hypothetical protein